MSGEDRHELTRERLLTEAEILFAQRGYDAVSVREITTAARSNLAAVNYHFGNKRNLYLEVFRDRWVPRARRLQKFFKESLAAQDRASPAAVAQALAQAFLMGPLSDEERCRHHQLMVRELGQPTGALELVADQVMRPFFKELADTLRPAIPEELDNERLMLNILSMFAVVLYFNFARVAVSRITEREYDTAFKDRLVKHIVGFSLNGLGGKKEEVFR